MDSKITSEQLMQDICDEEGFVSEWEVLINKSKYALNPYQTALLKQEIANGNRGIIVFKKFAISIPYIEEFYELKKYKPAQAKLTSTVEEVYKPIPPERWAKIREEMYAKIGKPIK